MYKHAVCLENIEIQWKETNHNSINGYEEIVRYNSVIESKGCRRTNAGHVMTLLKGRSSPVESRK